MEILASRMLFRPADYARSLSFYRDDLGLAIPVQVSQRCAEAGAGMVQAPGLRERVLR